MRRILFTVGFTLFACAPRFQSIEASKAKQITPFDADNDGDLDLFFIDDTNTLFFSTQEKALRFSTPTKIVNDNQQAIQAEHLLLVDLDGDQTTELLVAARRSGLVEISKIVAGPTIEPLPLEADASIEQFSVGDINSDGRPDLWLMRAIGNSQTSLDILVQSIDGSFVPFTSTVLPIEDNRFLLQEPIDLDNDSDLDLVGVSGTNLSSPNVKLFLNDGAGTFTIEEPTPSISEIDSLEVTDLNRDGSPDLLLFEDSLIDPSSLALLNDGAGNFTETRLSFDDLPLLQGASGDFNADGAPDMISQSCRRGLIEGVNPQKRLQISLNDGAGHFVPGESFSIPDKFLLDLQAIDLDNDGLAEVVYVLSEASKFVVVDF
jgi:hypothetical protein